MDHIAKQAEIGVPIQSLEFAKALDNLHRAAVVAGTREEELSRAISSHLITRTFVIFLQERNASAKMDAALEHLRRYAGTQTLQVVSESLIRLAYQDDSTYEDNVAELDSKIKRAMDDFNEHLARRIQRLPARIRRRMRRLSSLLYRVQRRKSTAGEHGTPA